MWALLMRKSSRFIIQTTGNILNIYDPMLWNFSYDSCCGSRVKKIIQYGSEIQPIERRGVKQLLQIEMDSWSKANKTSRMERIRKKVIREQIKIC